MIFIHRLSWFDLMAYIRMGNVAAKWLNTARIAITELEVNEYFSDNESTCYHLQVHIGHFAQVHRYFTAARAEP